MAEALVVADIEGASEVYGVHGGSGLARWKALARRAGLRGSWEAIEWAWVSPGGVCGEHLHSRTEELYFILSGLAEVRLNGTPHRVDPGTVILTGLGAVHGLRSVGAEPVSWLVIELNGRASTAALQGIRSSGTSGEAVTSPFIANLREVGQVNAAETLSGGLRTVEIVTLDGEASVTVSADRTEHSLFVLEGTGEAVSGETRIPLAYGTAITLPLGAEVRVVAGDGGLEYFHAVLAVPEGEEP